MKLVFTYFVPNSSNFPQIKEIQKLNKEGFAIFGDFNYESNLNLNQFSKILSNNYIYILNQPKIFESVSLDEYKFISLSDSSFSIYFK